MQRALQGIVTSAAILHHHKEAVTRGQYQPGVRVHNKLHCQYQHKTLLYTRVWIKLVLIEGLTVNILNQTKKILAISTNCKILSYNSNNTREYYIHCRTSMKNKRQSSH